MNLSHRKNLERIEEGVGCVYQKQQSKESKAWDRIILPDC